jgi:hypothetical protein
MTVELIKSTNELGVSSYWAKAGTWSSPFTQMFASQDEAEQYIASLPKLIVPKQEIIKTFNL